MTLFRKYLEIVKSILEWTWKQNLVTTLTLRRPTTTIIVRNNNVEKALRVLKRKIKKNGLMQELKERQYYTKASKKKRLAKKRGIARVKKEMKNVKRCFNYNGNAWIEENGNYEI